MGKVRKLQVLFVLGLFMVSFLIGVGSASGQGCVKEEYFTVFCETNCIHAGTWGCWEADQDRCCVEHVDGDACGDSVTDASFCPECVPGACGF